MDREELGLRLCNWHSSMNDPIYAVGSFYVSGQVYPDQNVVENALYNLENDLETFQKMLQGEVVMVTRHRKLVSLKDFAGYTNLQLRENIDDLEEVVSELQMMIEEDYPID